MAEQPVLHYGKMNVYERPEYQKVDVSISQQHIDEGKPYDCHLCMMSIAVHDAGFEAVEIIKEFTGGEKRLRAMAWSDADNAAVRFINTPSLEFFVHHFDIYGQTFPGMHPTVPPMQPCKLRLYYQAVPGYGGYLKGIYANDTLQSPEQE